MSLAVCEEKIFIHVVDHVVHFFRVFEINFITFLGFNGFYLKM